MRNETQYMVGFSRRRESSHHKNNSVFGTFYVLYVSIKSGNDVICSSSYI